MLLRRGHGDDEELLGPGRLDLVLLARHDVDAGERLEPVRLAADVERALAGDDEEHLLAVAEPTRVRPAGREADHALDEPLAARRGVDRRAHARGVAVLPPLVHGLLGNDVAVHRIHCSAKAS